MNQSLQEKIFKMGMEDLKKIIENSELYSPEAVELAKKQVEALEEIEKINATVKAKFEAMNEEEVSLVLKEPDLYNKDVVKLAKAYMDKHKNDFSDVPEEAKAHLAGLSAEQLMDMLDEIRQDYDLSILMTTHDFSMLPTYADQVILMNQQILLQGTPEEVLSSEAFNQVFHRKGACAK